MVNRGKRKLARLLELARTLQDLRPSKYKVRFESDVRKRDRSTDQGWIWLKESRGNQQDYWKLARTLQDWVLDEPINYGHNNMHRDRKKSEGS